MKASDLKWEDATDKNVTWRGFTTERKNIMQAKVSFLFYEHLTNKIHMAQGLVELVKGPPGSGPTAAAHDVETAAESARARLLSRRPGIDADMSMVGVLAIDGGKNIVWLTEVERREA